LCHDCVSWNDLEMLSERNWMLLISFSQTTPIDDVLKNQSSLATMFMYWIIS